MPLRCGAAASVMKNWLPLVSLPRLAMTSRPSRSTGADRSSSANVPPSVERGIVSAQRRAARKPGRGEDAQIDSPPVPLCLVKSPPWIMNWAARTERRRPGTRQSDPQKWPSRPARGRRGRTDHAVERRALVAERQARDGRRAGRAGAEHTEAGAGKASGKLSARLADDREGCLGRTSRRCGRRAGRRRARRRLCGRPRDARASCRRQSPTNRPQSSGQERRNAPSEGRALALEVKKGARVGGHRVKEEGRCRGGSSSHMGRRASSRRQLRVASNDDSASRRHLAPFPPYPVPHPLPSPTAA